MHSRFAIPLLGAAALAASTAWAVTEFDNPNASPSGAHYRQGYAEPQCGIVDGRMTCSGTQIAGVGNLDGDVSLSVSASATIECTNGGTNVVEVKQKSASTTTGDAFTKNRNGTLVVSEISATAPSADDLVNTAECPKEGGKKNWTPSLKPGTYGTSHVYLLIMQGFQDPVIHQP